MNIKSPKINTTMKHLREISIVCLKAQDRRTERRVRELPMEDSDPATLDEQLTAITKRHRFTDRIEALSKLANRGEKLVHIVQVDLEVVRRSHGGTRVVPVEEWVEETLARFQRDGICPYEIFCIVELPLGELGLMELETPYYRACSLVEFVTSGHFTDQMKMKILNKIGVQLDVDGLLDRIADVQKHREADQPCHKRDQAEVECCKALLDYVLRVLQLGRVG